MPSNPILGNTLSANGTGTATFASLNLAGGANYVTGVLPTGNQAAQTMGGDVTGTTAANTVISITGTSGIIQVASTGNVITWAAPTTAPGLTQVIATSGATPANITISPQAPNASSATTASGTPGSCIINYASPVSTGTEAFVTIMRAGSTLMQLGAWTQVTSNAAIYGPVTPGNNNYALEMQATATTLNGVNHSWISVGGTTVIHVSVGGPGNVQFFDGQSTQFGGGSGVIGISNATVNPTSNPSGGIILYSSLTTGALSNRSSSGWIKTLSGNTATTINSQLMKYDELIATGEITTTAGTVVLNVPLLTSISTVRIEVETQAKTTVAGTGTGATSVGDTYSTGQRVTYKNISGSGTLTTPASGAAIVVDTFVDTSLAQSTFSFGTSGTNVTLTLTINKVATATTLGTIDCIILARCFYN